MRQDEVHKGLLVQLLTDYANVPTGTWAMVDRRELCTTALGGLPSSGDRIHRFQTNFHLG
jgi:hypothetical protein